MPRRLFKTLSRQRHRWKQRWFMRPFRLLLEHPAYWTLNRRSVTRAFALGLFISFVPLPVHIIVATAAALLLRLNVPAAIAGTFLANPLTMVPMYIVAYWVGCQLLGIGFARHRIRNELGLADDGADSDLETVPARLPGARHRARPSRATSLLGGIWHLSLVLKYHKRKEDSARRESAVGKK